MSEHCHRRLKSQGDPCGAATPTLTFHPAPKDVLTHKIVRMQDRKSRQPLRGGCAGLDFHPACIWCSVRLFERISCPDFFLA